jgi:hypothetical protein
MLEAVLAEPTTVIVLALEFLVLVAAGLLVKAVGLTQVAAAAGALVELQVALVGQALLFLLYQLLFILAHTQDLLSLQQLAHTQFLHLMLLGATQHEFN